MATARTTLRVAALVCWTALFLPPARAQPPTCDANDTSQAGMTACAGKSAGDADAELNRVYQQVLKANAADRAFTDKLKAAQRAWLAFRDAHLAARYPDPADAGSVYPTCADGEIEELTRQRTAQLRKWIEGTEEGDVCAGSYPDK